MIERHRLTGREASRKPEFPIVFLRASSSNVAPVAPKSRALPVYDCQRWMITSHVVRMDLPVHRPARTSL